MVFSIRMAFCLFMIFTSATVPIFCQSQNVVRVPFIGCESDGQVGPKGAPKRNSIKVRMNAIQAKKLAYYQDAWSPGVLAPRGWHCFGAYGSNGSFLLVTPQPLNKADIFSGSWSGIGGPGIQVTVSEGQTSGRFDVARVIARVFPKEKEFLQSVINEKIEPSSDFPIGPYPDDKLVYKGEKTVEYHTPPNAKGLGTMSRLRVDDLPIDGVAMLTPGLSLLRLFVKLPPDMMGFKSQIVQQFEQEDRNED
jgi:hypothetical protein